MMSYADLGFRWFADGFGCPEHPQAVEQRQPEHRREDSLEDLVFCEETDSESHDSDVETPVHDPSRVLTRRRGEQHHRKDQVGHHD